MEETLRAALIQHRNRGGREKNLAHIGKRLAEAARHDAALVLLQELHNGSYFCKRADPSLFDHAEDVPGPTTRALGRLAAQHGLVIVGSVFERRIEGVYHNTAVVLDSDGTLVGRYRKSHIPDDPGYHEKFYFTPGERLASPVDTSVGRLGVLVCWDQWFPEAARLQALAGAQLLLYPTAIGWDPLDDDAERARQRDAWVTIQRGHAIANGIPVLTCNRVGYETDEIADVSQTFWGSSFIAGPQGELLAQADSSDDELLIADLDLARTRTIRRIWPFLRDRRVDLYSGLSERLLDS